MTQAKPSGVCGVQVTKLKIEKTRRWSEKEGNSEEEVVSLHEIKLNWCMIQKRKDPARRYRDGEAPNRTGT